MVAPANVTCELGSVSCSISGIFTVPSDDGASKRSQRWDCRPFDTRHFGHRMLESDEGRWHSQGLMRINDLLLNEFDSEMAKTRATLERVPGVPDFAPHPKSMPLGRLAPHIAQLGAFGIPILTM